ncbi:SDR family NAD(P)-dependent oxidoreductase [Raineyella fluvialis]|uniref:SDR family oxidoreductase n=1 Tax=Raineyella fluvialis TaxID=2662261 RepID=A0A5Q2F815_9ACTN|nr:SDR family NAD(P)-dependent oxidoreductase [Raineyella fluvialis]QGF23042.1 SDR family oxidoreductase [Raineyella fluvialis]
MSFSTGIGTRTAVVTGASSLKGIGFHTALRFAQEGWAVAMIDINAAGLERAADAVREQVADAQVATFALDITDPASIAQAAQTIADSDLPPVGSLCNIAGIPSPASFLDLTLEEWNRVHAVNLTGPFLLSQAFVPQMIAGGYGRVVNMSSVTAQHGGGVFSKTSYASAKAGVLGLTRGMARELAQYGITVNAVAPGVVSTEIRGNTSDQAEQALADAVPLKRQARPDEIADLFLWLSCQHSAYITGITHSINGGTYIA